MTDDALEIMKTYRPQQYEKLFEKSDIIQMQVSDSLVFIFPKDFCNIMVAVSWLSVLQFLLAQKGIYVRGSINSGAMYIDKENDRYYGEAWNKAVRAEEKAVTPRILIEHTIARILEEELRKINESVMEFFVDQDGELVLTSYTPMVVMAFLRNQLDKSMEEAYTELLDNLSFHVEQAKDNPHLLRKYLWISQHIIVFGEKDDMLSGKVDIVEKQIIRYLTGDMPLERVLKQYC